MKKLLSATIAMAALMPGTSNAQTTAWTLTSGGSDTVMGFESSSIRRVDGRSIAWTISIHREPLSPGDGAGNYVLQRVSVDCISDTYRVLATNYFRLNGEGLQNQAPETAREISVPPGSIASDAILGVCNGFDSTHVFERAQDAASAVMARWASDDR